MEDPNRKVNLCEEIRLVILGMYANKKLLDPAYLAGTPSAELSTR
jgi:hypothetical protein